MQNQRDKSDKADAKSVPVSEKKSDALTQVKTKSVTVHASFQKWDALPAVLKKSSFRFLHPKDQARAANVSKAFAFAAREVVDKEFLMPLYETLMTRVTADLHPQVLEAGKQFLRHPFDAQGTERFDYGSSIHFLFPVGGNWSLPYETLLALKMPREFSEQTDEQRRANLFILALPLFSPREAGDMFFKCGLRFNLVEFTFLYSKGFRFAEGSADADEDEDILRAAIREQDDKTCKTILQTEVGRALLSKSVDSIVVLLTQNTLMMRACLNAHPDVIKAGNLGDKLARAFFRRDWDTDVSKEVYQRCLQANIIPSLTLNYFFETNQLLKSRRAKFSPATEEVWQFLLAETPAIGIVTTVLKRKNQDIDIALIGAERWAGLLAEACQQDGVAVVRAAVHGAATVNFVSDLFSMIPVDIQLDAAQIIWQEFFAGNLKWREIIGKIDPVFEGVYQYFKQHDKPIALQELLKFAGDFSEKQLVVLILRVREIAQQYSDAKSSHQPSLKSINKDDLIQQIKQLRDDYSAQVEKFQKMLIIMGQKGQRRHLFSLERYNDSMLIPDQKLIERVLGGKRYNMPIGSSIWNERREEIKEALAKARHRAAAWMMVCELLLDVTKQHAPNIQKLLQGLQKVALAQSSVDSKADEKSQMDAPRRKR